MNSTSRDEMKLNDFEMSETYQATASIQLRTHPTHSTINFSELGKKLLESARNGDTEEILELINTGAPFTTDWLGASPLHYASQYGHVDTVEALLRSGIAKDARTKIDRTALHVAAQEGHADTVSMLVQFGADVDAKDMLRMTPLHWAVQRGHRDIIEVLLNNGADVNIVNKFDKTPIDIAYSSGFQEYVPLLQNFKGKAKPKVNPIETSIPVRLLKNSNTKKLNKSQNANRSFSNKVPITIKQEIDDDIEDRSLGSEKSNKKDLLHNVISNGQTISLTETGKFILNSYKDQQTTSAVNTTNNSTTNSNKKLIAIYPQSNIVLLSNNQTGSKNDSPIKVMPKKPLLNNDGKNSKSITVDKLPFYNNKPVSQVVKRYVINTNQTSAMQEKDDEIKRLNETIKCLKKELEDYKSLIISKDLEIEKLKKQRIT